MSRQSKGPRLYLRKGRLDSRTGQALPDRFFIRDGKSEIGTGCGPERMGDAERKLAAYIADKWQRPAAESDPAQVLVADVLTLYGRERGPTLKATQATMKGFVRQLIGWWGDKSLSDVRRTSCAAYVKHRTAMPIGHGKTGRMVSSQTARRELEVLSAAIGYWSTEHHLTHRPVVVLPEKAESHRDAITRDQAAALLKAAMGYRLEDKAWTRLGAEVISHRRHLRRFVLIAVYTGTRSGPIKRLHWTESLHDPWADLHKGIIYRRGRGETEARNKKKPLVKLPRRLLAHMRRWSIMDEKKGYATVLHFAGEPVASIRTGFAGIASDAGLKGVTAHWLRHTAATWLMERGVDGWEAAGYLGMTPATLEKHYGHHRPDHQSAARKAMG